MFLHRGWALWGIRKERTILLRKTMFSPRKNERKCQISRPSVAWIDDTRSGMRRHCKLWFRPKCTERDFRQLQNVTVTIPLNLKFCPLISKSFKTCWSELYLAIGLSTSLLQWKNFILSSANRVLTFQRQLFHATPFSLVHTWSSEYCCIHCHGQRAVTTLLWKSTINLVLKNTLLVFLVKTLRKLN